MLNIKNTTLFHLFISGSFLFNIYSNFSSFLYGKFPFYIMLSGFFLVFSFFYSFKKKQRIPLYGWWLVICILAFYFIQLFIITESNVGNFQIGYSFDNHRFLIFTMPLYVLLGVVISTVDGKVSLNKIDYSILFIIIFSVLSNTNLSLFRLDFNSFIGGHAVYLLLGDMLAIVGFYYVVKSHSNKLAYMFFLLFLVLLLLIYSRTSLYFYFFVGCIYLLWLNVKQFFIVSITLIVILTLFLTIGGLSLGVFDYGMNRMFFLFTNEQDSSANQRFEIMYSQLDLLLNNWYLGEYGGQVGLYGKWGAYIHNFISIWRQFGFIVFLLYLQFMFSSFYYVFNFFIKKEMFNKYSVTILIVMYSLLCILFSRSYVYPYFYIYFGCVLGMYCSENRGFKLGEL